MIPCEHLQRHAMYMSNYKLDVDGVVVCKTCGSSHNIESNAGDLRQLQNQHRVWVQKNFPEQKSHHGLLGALEELGELSHAHLKKEQGIRGDEEKHDHDIQDAIGDTIIFLISYCNTNGIDIASCVQMAWGEVMARDWTKNKENGIS